MVVISDASENMNYRLTGTDDMNFPIRRKILSKRRYLLQKIIINLVVTLSKQLEDHNS